MPNWASTTYKITGKAEDISELHKLINSFLNKEREPMGQGADPGWEGNIALALGEEIGENEYIRGFVQYVEMDGDVLVIYAEEAWNVTDLDIILRRHYKDMEVLYESEEWGDLYFVTNDKDKKFFSARYAISTIINGDIEEEYSDTEEEALQCVASRLGRKSITREEVDKWNESHEDDDSDVNHIEICEYSVIENIN